MLTYLQQYVKLPLKTLFNNTANNTLINVARHLSSAPKQISFILFIVQQINRKYYQVIA
jgi:hypothetical protein